MLLVITPLTGTLRIVKIFDFQDGTGAELFQAFQVVNKLYEDDGTRHEVNIALVPIGVDQVGDWLDNSINPNWWQKLTGRIRYTIHHMVRD